MSDGRGATPAGGPTWWSLGTREVGDWRLEHRRGGAEALHHAEIYAERPAIVLNEVTAPAVVVGSSQTLDALDTAAIGDAGLELARRRSGGGAVLLVPGEHVWLDVVLPAGDRRWDDDVVRASWWLGEAWSEVLRAKAGDAGDGFEVHRSGWHERDAGRVACFAGVGPGEVVRSGRKVVGLSQRRTRRDVRFQTVVHLRWEPWRTLELLRPEARAGVRDRLERAVVAIAALGGGDALGDRSVAAALARAAR